MPEFVGPRIPLEESVGYVDFGVEPATVPLIAYGGSGIVAVCDEYCRISLYDIDNGSLVMGVTVTTADGLLVAAPTGFAVQLVMVGGTTAAIFVVTASITPTTTSIFVCVQPFGDRSAADRRDSWSASTWVQSDVNVTDPPQAGSLADPFARAAVGEYSHNLWLVAPEPKVRTRCLEPQRLARPLYRGVVLGFTAT